MCVLTHHHIIIVRYVPCHYIIRHRAPARPRNVYDNNGCVCFKMRLPGNDKNPARPTVERRALRIR